MRNRSLWGIKGLISEASLLKERRCRIQNLGNEAGCNMWIVDGDGGSVYLFRDGLLFLDGYFVAGI